MIAMSDIKIIFFDIDGTLVNPQTGRISEKTVFTLRQLREKGTKLCIVTGRPPASLPDFGDLHFDVFSTFNGSLCYTETETIFSNPISAASVQKVIQNAACLGRPVSIGVRDRLAANGVDKDLADYYALAGLVLRTAEDFDKVCQDDVYQIMIGCRESEYDSVTKGVADIKLAISWERAVDVVSTGGGKGNGIRKILEFYHLDPSESLAFGDSHNDLEMLQAAGIGVAMGNATQALKAIADDICGPVWDDGIYHYCISHGLI